VPVHAGTSLDPRQFFMLRGTSATNAVVINNGVGQIEQAPVSTTTDLAVTTLQGTPRNTTVLKATVGRASATHVGYAGSVTFKDGDSVLATIDVDTAGEATWSSSLLAVGEHRFSAIYGGVATSGYDYLSSQATPVVTLVGTPQMLSVTALADVTWGAASTMRQVFASSSLGIPVAYAVTGPATIDADGFALAADWNGFVMITRWAIEPGAEGKDGAPATLRAAGTSIGNLPIPFAAGVGAWFVPELGRALPLKAKLGDGRFIKVTDVEFTDGEAILDFETLPRK
jgi:hypothetical protein